MALNQAVGRSAAKQPTFEVRSPAKLQMSSVDYRVSNFDKEREHLL